MAKGYDLFSTVDPELKGCGGSGAQTGQNRGPRGGRPLPATKLVGEARKTGYGPQFSMGKHGKQVEATTNTSRGTDVVEAARA